MARRIAIAFLVTLILLAAGALFLFRAGSGPDAPGTVDVLPGNERPVTATPPPAGGGGTGFGRGGPVDPSDPRPSPVGPAPITDRFDEIDAALGQLVTGNIAFNTPERMRFGDTRTVALIASPTLDATTLTSEVRNRIGGADPIETESLQIAPVMEAQLAGGSAFTVTALTPLQQAVSRAAPTEWRWSVRAIETGTHSLHLAINAIVTVAGERYPRSIDVFDRDIEVEITSSQRVAMFLADNWQWLLGTIVIPLAVWRWSVRAKNPRKRRR